MLFASGAEVVEGLAAVPGHVEEDVHLVHEVRIGRRRFDLLVVVRPGASRDVGTAALPALAPVPGAVEAAFLLVGLDGRVDEPGIRRGHREADLADIALRQTLRDLPERPAAVVGLVDPGAGSSGEERPHVAPALVGRGIDGVRVARGVLQIGHTGVGAEIERAGPGGAAVLGPVHTAFAPSVPERPLGGHQDGVPIPRIHQDLAEVLRAGEARLLPGRAAVPAAVHPVAPADMAPAHVLSGAEPYDFRVRRIEGYGADGVGGVFVEDRFPGGAAVFGLPEPAGTHHHVPGGAPLRVHGDVGDAASHQGRADPAELQSLDRGGDRPGIRIRGLAGGETGGQHERGGEQSRAFPALAGPEIHG